MPSGLEIRRELDALVGRGIRSGAYAGAVAALGREGRPLFLRAYGHCSVLPTRRRMKQNMLFDLASVTKAVATTSSVMKLVDDGRLSTSDEVRTHLPEFGVNGKKNVTVGNLLTHTSGLPDWSDLYLRHSTRSDILREVCSMGLIQPAGESVRYSDLGFIVLGGIVERVAGTRLDLYATREIFSPLAMKQTMFNPRRSLISRCVPTEYSNWRLGILQGEVHDENAHAMEGVSGHAGLFSTAGDLLRFGAMVYQMGEFGGRRILSPESIQAMATNQTMNLNDKRGFGWAIKPEFTGNAGDWEIAHNGYTGISIAVSLSRRAFAAILTNRVHPVREGRVPEDKSVGIMMARRSRWTDYLPKFYQLSARLVEAND